MRAHAPSLRAQGAAWESRATVPPALGCLRRRSRAAGAGSAIYYYVVSWDAAKTSWEDFRGKVLGATDPAKAEGGSLRRAIYTDWKQLGLAAEPDVGDNGVAPTRTRT